MADIIPAPTDLGLLIIGLAFLVVTVGAVIRFFVDLKKLQERQILPRDLEFVNHAEFADMKRSVEAALNRLDTFATKAELAELRNSMDKSHEAIRTRLHHISDSMASLPVQVQILIKGQEKMESRMESLLIEHRRIYAPEQSAKIQGLGE